jgi:hypothetical protein
MESNLVVMKIKNTYPQRLIALFSRSWVFRVIVIVFVLQAAWIALTGRYPMAFDEDFHLGIIRLYAHHLSPFWSSQPAGGDAYGAVARDPSYLFHYLMSFPYRLVSAFTSDQTIQVLWLRAIDIALFASSLPLYRRLLLKTGASVAVVNFCFLIFILIPIVPLLAAQINYDNLLLPLLALTMLLTLRVSDELRAHKRLNMKALLQLLIVCLLASQVKYAFLPVFVAIIIYLGVRLKQTYPKFGTLKSSLGFGWGLLTRRAKWLLVIGVLISLALFMQRDGYNVIAYHTTVPSCDRVLSIQQCSAYGPWIRDYNYSIAKVNSPRSPLTFTIDWFYGMWLRSVFAVDGPGTGFETRGPLFLPAMVSLIMPAISVAVVLVYLRQIFRVYDATVLWLFAVISACYVGALWLDEYAAFLRTGQPVAINGRYLLVVALPLLLVACLGFAEFLKHQAYLRVGLAGITIVGLLWGGGALTYILRSNDNWYWPSAAVQDMNHAVQRSLGPRTPGYNSPDQFLH